MGDPTPGDPGPTPAHSPPPADTPPPADGPPPAVPNDRRVVSLLLILALLVVGILGSSAAAYSWRNAVLTEDQRAFDTTATGAAGTLNMALQRDADIMATTRTLIATSPTTDNADFGHFFSSLDAIHRFPGSFAFAFIQAVTPADLSQFSRTAVADPPFGIAPTGGFALRPSADRSQYCLMRLTSIELPVGAKVDGRSLVLLEAQFASFLDPGVDECQGPDAGLLDHAASTGALTVGSFAPILDTVLRRNPATRPVIIRVLGNLSPIEMLEPVYAAPSAASGHAPRTKLLADVPHFS